MKLLNGTSGRSHQQLNYTFNICVLIGLLRMPFVKIIIHDIEIIIYSSKF